MMNADLLLYCRPGFEKECAAEIMELTTQSGIYGYIKSKADSGYVIFVCQPGCEIEVLNQKINYADLIFSRQLVFISELLKFKAYRLEFLGNKAQKKPPKWKA